MTVPWRVGERLEQLELAARQIGAAAGDERLVLVAADLELADDERTALGLAGGAPAAAADHGLDPGHDLLGVARLGDPVVGAEPEPANPLGDGRLVRCR